MSWKSFPTDETAFDDFEVLSNLKSSLILAADETLRLIQDWQLASKSENIDFKAAPNDFFVDKTFLSKKNRLNSCQNSSSDLMTMSTREQGLKFGNCKA